MTFSPPDIEAIEARAKAATHGPWSVRENAHNHWGMREVIGSSIHCTAFTIASDVDYNKARQIEADAAFIASARTAVPALISALRERDAEIERLREQVDALSETDALFRRHVARKDTALKQAGAVLGEIYIEFNQDQIIVDTARTDIAAALADDKEPGR